MINGKKTLIIIYVLEFFWALSYALPLYAQSSFLGEFTSTKYVGLFIAAASFFSIITIYVFPRLIKKFHNYRILLTLLIVNFLVIILLTTAPNVWSVLFFFICYYVFMHLMTINMDVFLEDVSDDISTGKTRTMFLTIMNSAILIAPLIMGYLARDNDYRLVYLVSSFLFIPIIIILLLSKKYLDDHIPYKSRHIHELLSILKTKKDLMKIFGVAFTLRVFFALMVLYTPLYLHENLGFSWTQIGTIFFIMLIPYVILELPAGNMADKYIGEKELLVIGLIVMMVFTGLMFFITSKHLLVWSGMLFMTRVGAALVESMHEVYFFKLVSRRDTDLMNILRNMRPLGWLVGSGLAVITLTFFPIQYIFLLLALIILLTIRSTLTIKDTK